MSMTQEEIDALIKGETSPGGDKGEAKPSFGVDSPSFAEIETGASSEEGGLGHVDPKLELLYDLQLPVSIELGRTNMLIRDILRLGRGSVIEFEKLVSEPVDVLVNGKKVAEGEVVVMEKHFGIKITTLINPQDRLKSMRR